MTEGATPNLGTTTPTSLLTHGDDHLASGVTVGEYEVQGLLGEGGFGAVYRALHPVIGKHAAIKVLKREFSSQPDMVARFVAEARAVNQIRHRNIIDIFSFGVLPDGRQFFVMELLEGSSLEAALSARGALPLEQAAPILRGVARALGAAHAAGITHRDIKPENVFLCVDEDGQAVPKLLDFGIAKLVADKQSQFKTRSGIPMGTPLYMSPEQVHGKAVDPRSDVYSFGIMAFQVLTGRVPFDGESMMDVMMKQLNVEPELPSRVNPALPPSIDDPLLAMLSKDPDARPSSVVAAVDALLKAGGVEDAKTSARFDPLPVQTPSGPRSGISSTLGEKDTLVASAAHAFATPPRRTNRVWLGVAGVSLLVGVAVAWITLRSERQVAPPAVADTSAPLETPMPTATQGAAPTTTAVEVQPSGSIAPMVTAAPAASITLTVTAVPKDARVFDGDKELGKAGEAISLPRDEAERTLLVKRAGFVPQKITVKPTEDRAVGPVHLVTQGGKKTEWGEF